MHTAGIHDRVESSLSPKGYFWIFSSISKTINYGLAPVVLTLKHTALFYFPAFMNVSVWKQRPPCWGLNVSLSFPYSKLYGFPAINFIIAEFLQALLLPQ